MAEVKVNKTGSGPMSAQLINGQARVINGPMRVLVSAAFNVNPGAVTGPAWMDSERYDVIAKARPEATETELRAMLKTLLVERFKLVARVEDRPTAAFALTVGKGGPKLQESTPPANPTEQPCRPTDGPPEQFHMVCEHMTMANLAKMLPNMAPRYITMPVVDKTDVQGYWAFRLDWTPMAAPDGRGGDGSPTIETLGGYTMFDAVAKLGLKLERAKLPVPVVVVESAERVPVDN
ncbi:MAG TPA: TIGR03435 family protein [Candidatus Solibacter sp.]|nr:TIGR03435 family protein [Candidatus Solibacter sp.]